ncbi:MAG: DUF4012 domain-containing protein, partial [Candidatus Andersenbacteria bacterium]
MPAHRSPTRHEQALARPGAAPSSIRRAPAAGYLDLGIALDARSAAGATPAAAGTGVGAARSSPAPTQAPYGPARKLRSGISWFLVLAVGSTSAIGIATLVQHGRAAKQAVTADAGAAEASLKQAAAALAARDLDGATAQFAAAGTSFQSIGDEIDHLDGVLKAGLTLWPGNPAATGKSLAQAGVHLSTAGKALVDTLKRFDGVDVGTLAPPGIGTPGPTTPADGKRTLSQALAEAEPSFSTVVTELAAAADLLQHTDVRTLPSDVRTKIEPLIGELPTVRHDLEQVRGLFGTLADLTGANGARRFAIVFQNPNELRPTGGFMGQFAILKVDNGRVDRLDLKSIYDAAGQVKTRRAAPEGLNVINQTYALEDANWFPDFGTSAQSLQSFFAETGDPPVDGFVALNPALVTNLLAITGPVDLPAVDLRVTEDNFVDQAQYEVPKKDPARDRAFFPSFAQAFFAKVLTLDQKHWPDLLGALLTAVVRKDLQLHLVSNDAQHLADTLGANGALPATDTDGVSLVYANIGGGKTDQFVQETRTLSVTVGPSSVRHELEVTRTDTRTTQFKDKHNRDYVRLYVPAGSHLVEASGFDTDLKELVSYACADCTPDPLLAAGSGGTWEPQSNTRTYDEGGRTVFANWVTLAAGESRTFTLVYDTPRASV